METRLRELLRSIVKERLPFPDLESIAVKELESKFNKWCNEEIIRYDPKQDYNEIAFRTCLYCLPRIDITSDLLFAFMKWLAVIFFIDDKVIENKQDYYMQGYTCLINNSAAENELAGFYTEQARYFLRVSYKNGFPNIARTIQHWMCISAIEDIITSKDFGNINLMSYIRLGTVGMNMLFETNKSLLKLEGKAANCTTTDTFTLASQAVIIINDLYSFGKEKATGTEDKANAYIRDLGSKDFSSVFEKALVDITIVLDTLKQYINPENHFISEMVTGQLRVHEYLIRYKE